MNDRNNLQNQKNENFSLKKFSSLIENQEVSREILNKKELYASLNFDYQEEKELSWWERLFSSSKKIIKKLHHFQINLPQIMK